MPEHAPARKESVSPTAWASAFISSSSEIIIGGDREGRVVAWSEGAEEFYGYSSDEIIGAPLSTFRPAEGVTELANVLARLHGGERITPYETKHIKKDGSVVDVLVSPSAVRDVTGVVVGVSAIMRDVSDTKRIRETLEQAVEQERQMVGKLRELDRVRTTFVSSVSHELRTPLTSILGYLELLTEDASEMTEGHREMLDIVGRNSKRLLALIEDLLVLSRVESGAFRVLKEPVDVRSLVVAATCAISEEASKAGHELEGDVANDIGSVLGDSAQLERVLVGLLTNAVKFTPRGGHVRVTARRLVGEVELAVIDTGIGMSPAEQVELFTPFFRSQDAVRRAIQGTGLGLSIAKSIVDKHGGSLICESAPGEGTTMTVKLPFAIAGRVSRI